MATFRDGPNVYGQNIAALIASQGPYTKVIQLNPNDPVVDFDDDNFYCCQLVAVGAGLVSIETVEDQGNFVQVPIGANGANPILARVTKVQNGGATTATQIVAMGFVKAAGE